MWHGPAVSLGKIWPTKEHAIVAKKLLLTTTMELDEISTHLQKYASLNLFLVKKFGKQMSEASLIHKWHDRCINAADQVMMSSALTDPQVLNCLLDPAIHQFSHQVPSPSKDPFWVEPGQNHHGKLLMVICKHLITLATYLRHFLQLLYLIKNQKEIYLGPGIKGSTLPDVVKFLATYHLH